MCVHDAQATEALEKSQEEVKAANRKMQMAKSQKDSVTRELEHARGEQVRTWVALRFMHALFGLCWPSCGPYLWSLLDVFKTEGKCQ